MSHWGIYATAVGDPPAEPGAEGVGQGKVEVFGRIADDDVWEVLALGDVAMTREDFERVLRAFQRRKPCRPFTVQFVSGQRISVDHPEALVSRAGVAVYISSEGVPTLFDHESVSEVVGDGKQSGP